MSFLSSLFGAVVSKSYVSGGLYAGTIPYYSKSITSSGKAIFYLTDDGTTAGSAVFGTVFFDTIMVTCWATNKIMLTSNPVISADKKSVTIDVRENTSLLSLGLIPFAAASDGVTVSLSVRGL